MARCPELTQSNRTAFSSKILRKLEDSFSYGLSNSQACLLAGISESLFYEVCRNNPELSERFRLLKNQPKITATKNIINKINDGDVRLSQWYLERKAREEYGSDGMRKAADVKEKQETVDFVGEAKKRLTKYELDNWKDDV